MTSAETFLCKELLREYFGDVVADVGYFLATNGPCSLKRIVKETSRKNNQVRKALCVLVQHKLARFKQTKNKVVKYEADVSMMTQLAIFPRIIFTAKHLYGDEAELIVEEILQHGMMMMSTCVKNVMDRLQNDDSELLFQKVKAAFTSLVQAHFLKREPELVISDTPLDVPAFSTNEEDLLEYTLPKLSLKDLPKDKSTANNGEPAAKRQKLEDSQVDDGIYWSTSRDRFRQFMRDQLIVAAIGDKHGAASGEIARAVLRISEATTGAGAVKSQCVSAPEIARVLPKTRFAMNDALVKEYLRVLCNDSDHIIETFDEGAVGGSYYVNFKNAATAIATSSVLSYVKERFGSKSCRIFRLLLLKKHLEQKQVEEFAMIPSKESKGCLYSMLAENMLVMQEIPRTPDHAPSRTYYLFAVDLRKVVRMLLLRSYKILENLCVKRKHLIKGSQRLLDKQEKINAIKENLQDADQAQLDEIDEMMTSAELGQLTNHRHFVGKTYKAQIQVAKTVFIFDFYLNSLLLLLE